MTKKQKKTDLKKLVEDLEHEDRADPVEDPEISTVELADDAESQNDRSSGKEERSENGKEKKGRTKKDAGKRKTGPGKQRSAGKSRKRKGRDPKGAKKGKSTAAAAATGEGKDKGLYPWDF